jgi:hypothetical protein
MRGVYRVVGLLLIALTAFVGTVGSYMFDTRNARAAEAYYAAGIRNVTPPPGAIIVAPFSDQARASGLRTGQLLAVDGIDVQGDTAWRDKTIAALRGPDGSTVVLRIADARGVRDYRLTRSSDYLRDAYAGTGISFAGRERIRIILDITAALLVVAVLGLLYLRRPRDPVAALLVIGGALLTLAPLPFLVAGIPAWVAPLCDFLGSSAVHGGLILFPSGRLRPRWTLIAFLVVVLLALVAAVFAEIAVVPLIAIPLEALITLAVIIARFRSAPPGIERQQIKWAALGLATLAFFVMVQAVLTAALESAPNEGVRAWFILLTIVAGNLGILALCGGLLIALLRYRLYDAEAAISRSAVLASLTLVLLGIFTATEKVIEALGQDYFGASLGAMSGGAAAALAAILIAPLHHRLTHWSENRFQKDLTDLRRKLPPLVADLRETATSPELAGEVLQRTAAILRATCGAVIAGGNFVAHRDISPERLAEWRASWTPATEDDHDVDRNDPLFPFRVPLDADGTGRIGWLLLGARPDGSLYGKDEREVLAETADPIARGLAITMRREREAAAARAASERIEARMASLEALVERHLSGRKQVQATD